MAGSDDGGDGPQRRVVYRHVRRTRHPLRVPRKARHRVPGVDPVLFLARDRLGIKPVYYAEFDKGLRFASTLPALLATPGIDTSIRSAPPRTIRSTPMSSCRRRKRT